MRPATRSIERVSPAPGFAGAVVVERLLAQLERLEEPLELVIDDLHELDSEDALAWLELLLARLPAQLRVVLATREEPALGLHRLRLAGELTELRGPDLRFSLDETRALLRASGITLSDAAVASLHERTEGWPAGLRLAAISLAAHPDPERFVSEFSGSERTVAGYLLAEVLERQPPEVRDLLLRTSILERVSGPLADALTGGTGAEAILQRLEDQNAFVTALDAARTWFRYHHLFADLLRLELRRAAPATIPSLHRAAAAWHEQQGDVVEAVRHYQAAGDWAPAARLLVDNYLTLTMAGRGETLHALLGDVPGRCPSGRWKSRGCARDRQHPPRPARRGRRPSATSLGDSRRQPRQRGGASSTCTWPSSTSSSPAGAAICARAQRGNARTGGSARRRSGGGRAARAAGLLGARAHEPRASRSCGPGVPTTRGSTSRTRSLARAGSHGPSSRSAASRTSRSRRRSPGSRCRSRSS